MNAITPLAEPSAEARADANELRIEAIEEAADIAIPFLADVLKLDPENKAHKAKIIALLKTWIANGMFVVVDGEDEGRKRRSYIEVGKPAND
jgi:hypothetical protein